jgi:hypothetical protein
MHVSPSLSERDRKTAKVYFPIASDEHEFRSTIGRGTTKRRGTKPSATTC